MKRLQFVVNDGTIFITPFFSSSFSFVDYTLHGFPVPQNDLLVVETNLHLT